MPYYFTIDSVLPLLKGRMDEVELGIAHHYNNPDSRTFKAINRLKSAANEIAEFAGSEQNVLDSDQIIAYVTAKTLTESVDRKLFRCDEHLNKIPLRKEIDNVVEAVYLDDTNGDPAEKL